MGEFRHLADQLPLAAQALPGGLFASAVVALRATRAVTALTLAARTKLCKKTGTRASLRWNGPAPGRGRLDISDDGAGSDAELSRPGQFGPGHMRERAQELGGQLAICSNVDSGTHMQHHLSWEAR